jgi:hypothetical protein
MLNDPASVFPEKGVRPGLSDTFLDGPLKTIANRMAKSSGTNPDYCFGSMLAVAGACLGGPLRVVTKGFTQAPVLWVVLVGTSGVAKSPAMESATHPLRKLDADEMNDVKERQKKHHVDLEGWNIGRTAWKKQQATKVKPGEVGTGFAEPMPIPPTPIRHMVGGITVPALCGIKANHPRITPLNYHDELTGFFGGLNQYDSGKGSDRAFYLSAYDSGGFSLDRKGPGLTPPDPVILADAGIGMLGSTQPSKMQEMLTGKALPDDGMLSRWLIIDAEYQARPLSDEMPPKEEWQRVVSKLKSVQPVERLNYEENASEIVPRETHLTDDARRVFRAGRERIEAMVGEYQDEPVVAAMLHKQPGRVLRMGLLFAFLDWAAQDTGDPHPTHVHAPYIARALAFIFDYAIPMALFTYQKTNVTATQAHAAQIIERLIEPIEKEGKETFTQRQAHTSLIQKGKTRRRASKSQVVAALRELENKGWVRQDPPIKSKHGGSPSTVWRINPSVTIQREQEEHNRRVKRARAHTGSRK